MRITSLAAFALALGAAAATAYPVTVQFENNTWRVAVEPETATEIAPYTSVFVVINDVDQLARILSNMASLNSLAGWGAGAGLFVVLPGAQAAAPADVPPEGGSGGEAESGVVLVDVVPVDAMPADPAPADATPVDPAPADAAPVDQAVAPSARAARRARSAN